jgi:hypothetical protein
MASRAHAIHDYSLIGAPERHRRQVRFETNDPVVLPRHHATGITAGLLGAGAAAIALVAGATYAVYYTGLPSLEETPAVATVNDWHPDQQITAAQLTNVLSGPTIAVRDLPIPGIADGYNEPQVIVNDSAPGAQETFPQPAEPSMSTAPAAPYPNPTTTPPEGMAPPEASPQTPTPAVEPDNPYRDSEQF